MSYYPVSLRHDIFLRPVVTLTLSDLEEIAGFTLPSHLRQTLGDLLASTPTSKTSPRPGWMKRLPRQLDHVWSRLPDAFLLSWTGRLSRRSLPDGSQAIRVISASPSLIRIPMLVGTFLDSEEWWKLENPHDSTIEILPDFYENGDKSGKTSHHSLEAPMDPGSWARR